MAVGVHRVENSETLQALAQPVRLQILEALRQPESAADVARAIGQSRQNTNYHVKELERFGLVARAGERRRGNLVEPLYEAVAGTFVVSARATWGSGERARALADQLSLERLVELGETLQHDAGALLDRAAFDGDEIPTASVTADISFATEADRAAFMEEYLALLGPLLRKYGARKGEPFHVACAVYPRPDES